MNNTISNPAPTSTWKRAKAQYISAAAGLALSVSALVALVSTTGNASLQGPSVHGPIAAVTTNVSRGTPEIVFYLVSSRAQIDQAQRNEELAQWVRHDNGVMEPNRSVVFLSAATSEEAASAKVFIDNAIAASNYMSDSAPAFQVVDLRN